MPETAFARTFRRLLADRGGLSRTLVVLALFELGGWLWWAVRSQVTLYEVSPESRLELESATYPVQSPLLGRVVRANLFVEQKVQRNEVLVEIDAAPQQLQIQQENVRIQGFEREMNGLRSEVDAEINAREDERKSALLSSEEMSNRVREAEAACKYADAELLRQQKLQANGLIPVRDLEEAESDARQSRSALEAVQSAAKRLPQEQITRDRERDVRIQRLQAQIEALREQIDTATAGLRGLRYEVERRQIRAPVDGRVGEAAVLRPGAVVNEAESLASIIPAGRLRAVAQFPADAALGRIREGQTATLRLDGYPWAEFGVVNAIVIHVAQEIRDGKVRVELDIHPDLGFRGRLEHGMPGSIEVAVEHISPLALVLRAAGQWLTRRS